jgi:excisionase family DNA binding protein
MGAYRPAKSAEESGSIDAHWLATPSLAAERKPNSSPARERIMADALKEKSSTSEPVIGQLLYSIPQAARVLSVSEKLVRIYIGRGELKSTRLGARVVVHRRALEAFASRDHAGAA